MSRKGRGKCVFNDELAKKFPFIRSQNSKSKSDVHCNLCGANFSIEHSGKRDIENHIDSVKHQKAIKAVAATPTVTDLFKPVKSMAALEGVWSYHIVKANQSFASADCASKIFNTCFGLKDFKCARTKAEAIAVNVFAPLAQKMLNDEMAQSRYVTLITDASNHGNVKMVPVLGRFFIPTVGVKVKMMEFTSQKGETAEIINSLLIDTAKKNKIEENVVGFCGDNCPTNFGSCERGGDQNVFYLLKKRYPSLIGIGCGAHKCHNCLKHACDCLPMDIECIVVKIHSYFKTHTVRVEALKTLCDLFEDVEYSKLLGYSNTRFLALGPAVGSILKVFEPLKKYFLERKKCPKILEDFFNDPLSKFWLLFVKDQVNIKILSIKIYSHFPCICIDTFSFHFYFLLGSMLS